MEISRGTWLRGFQQVRSPILFSPDFQCRSSAIGQPDVLERRPAASRVGHKLLDKAEVSELRAETRASGYPNARQTVSFGRWLAGRRLDAGADWTLRRS